MSLRIVFASIGWGADEPALEVLDLAADMQFHVLFMMFANGNYLEARAVGESEDAIATFRRLMAVSGFPRIGVPFSDPSRLHRPGDEVYDGSAMVLLCPVPDPLLARGAIAAEPDAAPDTAV